MSRSKKKNSNKTKKFGFLEATVRKLGLFPVRSRPDIVHFLANVCALDD